MIELRESKYKPGDKVIDNQGNVYEILRISEYSFIHDDYIYMLDYGFYDVCGKYDVEFEQYLKPYKGE